MPLPITREQAVPLLPLVVHDKFILLRQSSVSTSFGPRTDLLFVPPAGPALSVMNMNNDLSSGLLSIGWPSEPKIPLEVRCDAFPRDIAVD